MPPHKKAVIRALCERVRSDLEAARRSQNTTQAGATHSENRAEHAKDTRATESSYLARGLAERVEDLADSLAMLEAIHAQPPQAGERIAIGALVTLEDEQGIQSNYFLAPAGGGEQLELGSFSVLSLTAGSPLGRVLIGRTAGDEIEATRPRGTLRATITHVR